LEDEERAICRDEDRGALLTRLLADRLVHRAPHANQHEALEAARVLLFAHRRRDEDAGRDPGDEGDAEGVLCQHALEQVAVLVQDLGGQELREQGFGVLDLPRDDGVRWRRRIAHLAQRLIRSPRRQLVRRHPELDASRISASRATIGARSVDVPPRAKQSARGEDR
jgi:hypothetical protein